MIKSAYFVACAVFAIGTQAMDVSSALDARPSKAACTLEEAISRCNETYQIEFNGRQSNVTKAFLHKLSYNEKAGRTFDDQTHNTNGFLYLTYSCSNDLEQIVNYSYISGTSAHFAVDQDGKIVQLVDSANVAFCAGRSAYRENVGLNKNSICIMLCHPATTEFVKTDKLASYGESIQIKGDSRSWLQYSDKQIESLSTLVGYLQKEFNIPGWNVISRGDTAKRVGPAPGPLFSYEKLAELGTAYWPANMIDCPSELTDEDIISLIQSIGYSNHEHAFGSDYGAMVALFKNHYGLKDLTKDITDDCRNMAFSVVVDRLTRQDQITKTFDTYLISKITELASSNERINLAFAEIL